MVDPNDVTKYDRTQRELEEFLLFCIVVAGKRAWIQAAKLENFLSGAPSPFGYLKQLWDDKMLLTRLEMVKMGQQSRIFKCFFELAHSDIDLKTCSTFELETYTGIGPKTSRFFVMHTRPNQRVATLDTHILRWMREELGVKTPKITPIGKSYERLEKIYLDYCDSKGYDPAWLDLEVWKHYSQPDVFAKTW